MVRLEIATGLRRGVRVIPVLVGGARMPPADELPEDLKPLAGRNALEITEPDFDNDSERLVQALAGVMGDPAPPRGNTQRRAGLYVGILVAVLGLAGIAAAVLRSRAPDAPRDATSAGAQAPAPSTTLAQAPCPTPEAADPLTRGAAGSFDPVGRWEVSGVGTDFRSSMEMNADQTYTGRGKVGGVYSEGTGSWERGANPRVVFFRAVVGKGTEVVTRMEVKEEQGGGYLATHSYYGNLILRRAAPR